MVIAPVLPVPRDLTDGLGKVGVRGKDRAPVAVAAQRFRREETGATDRCQVARFTPLIAGTETLRAVLYHRQAMARGNRVDCVKIGTLAVKQHRYDSLGARRYGGLDERRVDDVAGRIDVDIGHLGPSSATVSA